ncbi:hypothetical protein QAD02_013918 [Eretmocerus hayati]|uniref:Uncharacterized protein n=1 Tax=Eretmocerus hayati TaxID=131215 RepID=A0ACC2P5K6_9HYME|nr:hypothetical protein QAD02_013918 [Eretmocerus hayati]
MSCGKYLINDCRCVKRCILQYGRDTARRQQKFRRRNVPRGWCRQQTQLLLGLSCPMAYTHCLLLCFLALDKNHGPLKILISGTAPELSSRTKALAEFQHGMASLDRLSSRRKGSHIVDAFRFIFEVILIHFWSELGLDKLGWRIVYILDVGLE